MKKSITMLAALAAVLAAPLVQATPESVQDVENIRSYFKHKFPNVPLQEYANGVYAVDPVLRANWEAIEEFPPYETFVEKGKDMWEKPFKNGKSYKDCFGSPVVAHKYPRWDSESKMVVTLPLAINSCLKANGEKPLKYKKGPINDILSYIAYESRGQTTNVVVPNDPDAIAAYNDGKNFFYAKRGQLNFSCANCHVQSAGQMVRTNTLSPALGQTTHFPVYRSAWGTVGTLHRRFTGCNKQVRAKPFKAQGSEYRNLEYFLTHMSNGIDLNGPGNRQ